MDKEKRPYRKGLVYCCARCGKPKKGHTCTAGSGPELGSPWAGSNNPPPGYSPHPVDPPATPYASAPAPAACIDERDPRTSSLGMLADMLAAAAPAGVVQQAWSDEGEDGRGGGL
jgi:hypothetical protein